MWAWASSSWMMDIAEPKLLSAGAWLGRAQVRRRADELGVGRDGEDPAHALQVLGRHVLQALDQLAGGEMLLNLLLGERRELFDRGGEHGTLPRRYDT